ncbi:MAG TPA: dockerin type I domain-containing protein [Bacteroidales bacterium]|nr:dockerin type I domain-containing protein [Bacteroidales bacterium]HSA44801.1 dockerin type I domain-containing protein [Bacteroidales bacterium]
MKKLHLILKSRLRSCFLPACCLLLLLLGWQIRGSGQNITGLEYFFDNDPGFGLAVPVAVSPTPNLSAFSTAISIAGLPEGFHHLFFRAIDDSNRWSLTQNIPFFKNLLPVTIPDITAIEYFIDTDPGFGLGVPVAISPAPVLPNVSFAVDISSLPKGFHFILTRAKNADGRWSTMQYLPFFKEVPDDILSDITAAEYFFDNDPGFGNGTDIPLSPSVHISSLAFTVGIDSLEEGYHTLFVRVRDAMGKWSLTSNLPFFRQEVQPAIPVITQAEYYFDTDPGFGNGTQLSFSPGTNLTFSWNSSIASMTGGFHHMAVRVKDSTGKWSLTSNLPFFKQEFQPAIPDITQAEYFIDTDPGFGNATQLSFTPGTNKTISWIASIAALNQGFHHLAVRVKDSTGKWSLSQFLPFFKQIMPLQEPDIVKVEYFIDNDPGFGQAVDVAFAQDSNHLELAFMIDIQALSQGFHKLFIRSKDSRGKWSITQFLPFYKQILHDTLAELVAVEYYFDTDPGTGNGIPVAFTPAQQIPFLAWSLNLSGIAFGQHLLYVRTKDEYGVWSLDSRDTVFYYLDSLPTASLSGPQGICINASGQFEVLLTGTPPWNLQYFNGEDTITAQGIMNSPYLFDVAPTWHGTHTARILQVQDVYYTGLYTGIPIEYEVYPLPQAAGTISGSDNLCMGSGNSWYWINPVLYATVYQWTYPDGAVLNSNANQNGILLDFSNVTQSGTITVTPLNACGTGSSSSIYVNIRPLPVVDAGPDQNIPFNDSAIMAPVVTGGTEPYTYYWNPWYHLNNPYIPNATAYVNETTVFTLYVTDAYGCQGSDQVTIYVGLPPGTQVEGNFTYDNALMSPLNDATVMLKQGSELIASATTGANGDFVIQGIPAGNYSLSATSSKPWGGVNATDAMLVLQHFASIIFLNGLRLEAADVNATANINAIDALLIARRYAEIISTFPAGDWLSDVKTVNASGSGSITENLEGIVFGDVNGSYVPAAKLSREIELQTGGLFAAAGSDPFELPLYADRDLQAGAISLDLQVPEGLMVRGVRTARSHSFRDETEAVIWNLRGNRLRIAWYSLNPLQVNQGTALLWLRLEGIPRGDDPWELHENASIADAAGQSITPLVMNIPAVKATAPGLILEQNRPNPVSTTSLVSFCLPEGGLVKLSLKSGNGQTLRYLVQEQMPAGWHQLVVDAARFSPGIYLILLEFEGKQSGGVKAVKMIKD